MSCISEQNCIWTLIYPLMSACGQVLFIWQEAELQETDHNQYLVKHILLVELLLLAGSHSSLTHTVIWLVGRPAPAVYLEAEHQWHEWFAGRCSASPSMGPLFHQLYIYSCSLHLHLAVTVLFDMVQVIQLVDATALTVALDRFSRCLVFWIYQLLQIQQWC